MPRLLHDYLAQQTAVGTKSGGQNSSAANKELIAALLAEQRETNRLLQRLIYAATGFVIGALVVLVVLRLRQMGGGF